MVRVSDSRVRAAVLGPLEVTRDGRRVEPTSPKQRALLIDLLIHRGETLGRDRLIEAIDSIRDDFEKILVVTHLDELKEFFPARIEVTKGDAGSQLMVLA